MGEVVMCGRNIELGKEKQKTMLDHHCPTDIHQVVHHMKADVVQHPQPACLLSATWHFLVLHNSKSEERMDVSHTHSHAQPHPTVSHTLGIMYRSALLALAFHFSF